MLSEDSSMRVKRKCLFTIILLVEATHDESMDERQMINTPTTDFLLNHLSHVITSISFTLTSISLTLPHG